MPPLFFQRHSFFLKARHHIPPPNVTQPIQDIMMRLNRTTRSRIQTPRSSLLVAAAMSRGTVRDRARHTQPLSPRQSFHGRHSRNTRVTQSRLTAASMTSAYVMPRINTTTTTTMPTQHLRALLRVDLCLTTPRACQCFSRLRDLGIDMMLHTGNVRLGVKKRY